MHHPITVIRSSDPLSYTPDTTQPVTSFLYEKVGIDEVRLITKQAHLRPVSGDEYIFIIGTSFLTHEAQNALLKLFEEPPVGLTFQLVLPPGVSLLPTLLSRVGQEVLQAGHTDDSAWEVFVAATPADRLKQIDVWNKTKDPDWLQTIVRGLHTVDTSDCSTDTLQVIRLTVERLATRGASNKMLLEHLALALPLRN